MKIHRVISLDATRAVTAVVVAALGLSACATIIHSPRQQVGISSTPSGASVTIDNVDSGKTPLVTKLSRKQEHVLRIEMAGYKPFEATLTRKLSGWVFGNLVFG